ncbi:MAG: N-acetyl-gamma-glutamyl-phosphate reductase [Euryarchaeota archaeon]|nr:N-acetyl-gamma-glutamyl-phosphate reductase [Euryarchaeota archaeon]
MKVAIIGGSGYTGGELLRILAGYPGVDIEAVTSRQYAGKKVSAAHPNLEGILDIRFEEPELSGIAERADFVFTATPHGFAMEAAGTFLDAGLKMVDLSGDFRFDDPATYERYYGIPHTAPELNEKAVFGLPELYRDTIRKADLVANIGCYPTTAILGLVPALKAGIIEPGHIVVDSKSGISGAGARPTPMVHFCMADESALPYKITSHRHMPEIEQELKKVNPRARISFVPHIVPVIRGMTTTIHTFLREDVTGEDVRAIYQDFYRGEPFVRIWDAGEVPRMSASRGSNYIDIGGFGVDSERERLVMVVCQDNLVKGASGQAVQNMNIMCGFEESAGLKTIGVHP